MRMVAWTEGVAMRVERRGPAIDVLEVGAGGPGSGVRERTG